MRHLPEKISLIFAPCLLVISGGCISWNCFQFSDVLPVINFSDNSGGVFLIPCYGKQQHIGGGCSWKIFLDVFRHVKIKKLLTPGNDPRLQQQKGGNFSRLIYTCLLFYSVVILITFSLSIKSENLPSLQCNKILSS